MIPRGLLHVLVALFMLAIGWQVVVQGRAAIESSKILETPFAPPDTPLPSSRLSDEALVVLAEDRARQGSPDASEALALQALAINPASGRASSHLLSLYAQQQRLENTEPLAELTARLWPSHTFAQSRLAYYWSMQGRVDKVLAAWSALLARNPGMYKAYFPALADLLASDENRVHFTSLIEKPPSWWGRFFDYLAEKSDIAVIRWIFTQRINSKSGITSRERASFVQRLVRERQWREAYRLWVDGLEASERSYLGNVFDGGFESNLFNREFGWQIKNSSAVKIIPELTYGMKGRAALHVRLLKSKPAVFNNVQQTLLLEPGAYVLTMQYRLDTFRNTKGLWWRLYCLGENEAPVGESIALVGTQPWKTLDFRFVIPDAGCRAQSLRLESPTGFAHDHSYQGSLWFDDVAITPANDGPS